MRIIHDLLGSEVNRQEAKRLQEHFWMVVKGLEKASEIGYEDAAPFVHLRLED